MRKIIVPILLFTVIAVGCQQEVSDQNEQETKETLNLEDSVETKKILYTTATVNDGLPSFIGETDSTLPTFNEDEWRQIEFISKSFKTEIDSEIVIIRDVYDNKSFNAGSYQTFSEVAVRTQVPNPINIPYPKLLKIFGQTDSELIKPIGMYENTGVIENSFSFSVKGLTFYGIKDDQNNVTTFCIFGAESPASININLNLLSSFIKSQNLYLVDWRAVNIYDEATILTDLLQE